MSQRKDIPVSIQNRSQPATQSEQVKALLNEIRDMLSTLAVTGEHNYIDIRSLPMSPNDVGLLKEILGHGEVEATVKALGPTHICETQVPGVWWVTNKNSEDVTISEYIEVTTLPEILVTQHQDLHDSVAILDSRLKTYDAS